jgi:hypothetical protein
MFQRPLAVDRVNRGTWSVRPATAGLLSRSSKETVEPCVQLRRCDCRTRFHLRVDLLLRVDDCVSPLRPNLSQKGWYPRRRKQCDDATDRLVQLKRTAKSLLHDAALVNCGRKTEL